MSKVDLILAAVVLVPIVFVALIVLAGDDDSDEYL